MLKGTGNLASRMGCWGVSENHTVNKEELAIIMADMLSIGFKLRFDVKIKRILIWKRKKK